MSGKDATAALAKGRDITCTPLSAAAFAPFGDVLEISGRPDRIINAGMCGRHHDLARLDFSDGRAGISLFDAQPRALPYTLDLLERHPAGSQAFIPLNPSSFLICVAHDEGGVPGRPLAFLTRSGQAINLHRGVWHGVLTPLDTSRDQTALGLFAVIDRIGSGPNLEEHRVDPPWRIIGAPNTATDCRSAQP